MRLKMEQYLPISFLNDFIFCPRSIYFHQLYRTFDTKMYTQAPQLRGLAAHQSIDKQTYSTRKTILQGIDCYSEQFNLCGKIDLYDRDKKLLIERKRTIKTLYDGYIFQIYAQYFCLTEMGYEIEQLQLRDLTQNKHYAIPLPQDSPDYYEKFRRLIDAIHHYDLLHSKISPSLEKCKNCIYNTLCDHSLC